MRFISLLPTTRGAVPNAFPPVWTCACAILARTAEGVCVCILIGHFMQQLRDVGMQGSGGHGPYDSIYHQKLYIDYRV
jgi:hypothetical protein